MSHTARESILFFLMCLTREIYWWVWVQHLTSAPSNLGYVSDYLWCAAHMLSLRSLVSKLGPCGTWASAILTALSRHTFIHEIQKISHISVLKIRDDTRMTYIKMSWFVPPSWPWTSILNDLPTLSPTAYGPRTTPCMWTNEIKTHNILHTLC